MPTRITDNRKLFNENPIFKGRTKDVGYLDLTGCMALGITGPILRATGLPRDLRKTQPYCGYETYGFDVATGAAATSTAATWSGWTRWESRCKIVEQASTGSRPGPVMIEDKKIGWPAQLALGPDGMGNSPDHIRAHHGRVDGGPDPPLQAGDRGLPGAGRPGVRVGRVAARRARRARGQRRRHPALPGPLPRPVVQQPAGRPAMARAAWSPT